MPAFHSVRATSHESTTINSDASSTWANWVIVFYKATVFWPVNRELCASPTSIRPSPFYVGKCPNSWAKRSFRTTFVIERPTKCRTTDSVTRPSTVESFLTFCKTYKWRPNTKSTWQPSINTESESLRLAFFSRRKVSSNSKKRLPNRLTTWRLVAPNWPSIANACHCATTAPNWANSEIWLKLVAKIFLNYCDAVQVDETTSIVAKEEESRNPVSASARDTSRKSWWSRPLLVFLTSATSFNVSKKVSCTNSFHLIDSAIRCRFNRHFLTQELDCYLVRSFNWALLLWRTIASRWLGSHRLMEASLTTSSTIPWSRSLLTNRPITISKWINNWTQPKRKPSSPIWHRKNFTNFSFWLPTSTALRFRLPSSPSTSQVKVINQTNDFIDDEEKNAWCYRPSNNNSHVEWKRFRRSVSSSRRHRFQSQRQLHHRFMATTFVPPSDRSHHLQVTFPVPSNKCKQFKKAITIHEWWFIFLNWRQFLLS